MSFFRTSLLFSLLALPAAPLLAADAHSGSTHRTATPIGVVVAVVNDDVITRHELDKRIAATQRNLKRQGIALPNPAILEKQVLEALILEKILLQAARDNGIRITDEALDSRLLEIAHKNNLRSLDEYRARLEKEGANYAQFREEARTQIAIATLRDRDVLAKISISNSDVDHFLEAEASQPGHGMAYHLGRITVTIPNQASAEKVQASQRRASDALAQLRKGASFAQVAASYSDDQDAMRGGDSGWHPAEQIPFEIRAILSKLRPGEVSSLVHTPNSYLILKLIDSRHQDNVVLETQTHVRHILIRSSEQVPDSEAKRRILEIRKRIEGGSSFADEARRHSEDGSAAQGGDLGWASPGMMVPEFEQAMNALQPGELSHPVQTSFGWHLIQVLDRRRTDVSDTQKRQHAYNSLRSIRAENAVQDWYRQMRDSAHVEYLAE